MNVADTVPQRNSIVCPWQPGRHRSSHGSMRRWLTLANMRRMTSLADTAICLHGFYMEIDEREISQYSSRKPMI
ncbi:hypothetical protein [Burkholderia diffusa]|uniref:hypothetical protein n=1 Tax=Burkholderia diffusa TaxID=488732 RepID=UPI0012D99DEF|nr:hypothetical protein [Burkholderia diffusa]